MGDFKLRSLKLCKLPSLKLPVVKAYQEEARHNGLSDLQN